MEWVLLLNELPGKMVGPILVQVFKKSLNALNKIHLLSTCSVLGTEDGDKQKRCSPTPKKCMAWLGRWWGGGGDHLS